MGAMLPSGSSRKGRRAAPPAEINITPLVDVMLVLLIIFMVTAPMMTTGVPVNLPSAPAQALPSAQEQRSLVVTVTAQGQMLVESLPYSLEGALDKLKAMVAASPDLKIFLRADQDLPYGKIMEVLGMLSRAGLSQVALLTQPVQDNAALSRP